MSQLQTEAKPVVSRNQALGWLRQMMTIRRFEERAEMMYQKQKIGGFFHQYSGQEPVAVGSIGVLREDDYVITAYRDHGHMLATGMEPKGVMAELTGRRHGYAKGKGGSMHMFSVEKNFYGGHGIVGAPAPLGTGIAFANKYRGNDRVCLTYFGEGAANQGQVYESFNMASLWKLPVLYIIENNHYAMGTHVGRGSARAEELYSRGSVFGIPGEQVDGMDVVAVRDAGERAVARARRGEGPKILEMRTYRYRGHSMSDPAKYRTREEVQGVREQRDPIDLLRKRIIEGGRASEDQLKEIDREVRALINEAAEFAQQDPEPDSAELYSDVTAEPT